METNTAQRKIRRRATGKKPRKPKLSKEERAKKQRDRKFRIDINTVFKNSRFEQIPTRDLQIDVAGRQGEIDNVFIHENVIVVLEDTTSSGDHLKSHILKTVDFFKHLSENVPRTLQVLDAVVPRFREVRKPEKYDSYIWIYVYASLHSIDRKYEGRHKNLLFLHYAHLQYFLNLSKTIGSSTRFELFRYLNVNLIDVGTLRRGQEKREYQAVVLPESPSGFPEGHKIVSFLVEPRTLLEQAYVLRIDGWQDSECLYQRLLIKNKIATMRQYLAKEQRVFVNNIIATLPPTTRFLDNKGDQIPASRLTASQVVTVEIRRQLSSIGLVDGQHRVFAYHEGLDQTEEKISILRDKQHLLVTAIVYPENVDAFEQRKFEAKLFLEINDKQTRAKGDLKQSIQTIVDPFSEVAIAKRVVTNLARSGPLLGLLEEHFFDRQKIKTTSIVSYGLRHIVGIYGKSSLINIWDESKRKNLKKGNGKQLLDEYVEFCTDEIQHLLAGFRQNIDNGMWTPSMKISRVLTTTTINGLIFCLRQLIDDRRTGDVDYYKNAFKKIRIDFRPGKFTYRSSHWRDLGNDLFKQCFS